MAQQLGAQVCLFKKTRDALSCLHIVKHLDLPFGALMGIYNSGAVEMQVLVTPAYVKVFFFLFSQIIRSLQAL